MVIFITNRKHLFMGATVGEEDGAEMVRVLLNDALATNDFVGLDFETTGLDPLVSSPLLISIGNNEIQLVLDCTSVDIEKLLCLPIQMLNHHVKFDIKFLKVHYPNVRVTRIYDTMIAEQKLFQNTSRSFSLDKTLLRYCGTLPAAMIKDVRKGFIGANPKTIIFTNEQIEYAAADVSQLHEIMTKQQELAEMYNLRQWLEGVEFPLIEVLANAELKGFALDADALRKIIAENIEIRYHTSVELDAELRKLRDTLLPVEEKSKLKNGKYDRVRQRIEKPQYEDLFGATSEYDFFSVSKGKNVKTDKGKRTVKFDENVGNINWSSSDEILDVFAKLKQPAPLQGEAEQKYGYLIPVIIDGKLRKGLGIDKTGTQVGVPNFSDESQGFTVSKKAFIKYFIDFPETPMRRVIELLSEYNRACHEINSFGENFINNLNPRTGRIHTTYRQCEAVNGRLQSGGGKSGESDKINFQNIPRDVKFRHLFHDGPGRSIVTVDLTGAEVTFMCDKANDEKLYEWAVVNDDSHSPMVQNVWRHIYLYRAGVIAQIWDNFKGFIKLKDNANSKKVLQNHTNPLVVEYYNLSTTFIVSKKKNTPYRQAGKNGTFGGIYGMKPKKAQETFNGTDVELAKENPKFRPVNVTLDEGSVILFAQKRAIPKTFAMVERNVQTAYNQGYLILNDRSYSRIWFEGVINMFKQIRYDYGSGVNITHERNGSYNVFSPEGEYMGQEELDWKDSKDVDGQARNVPISGTQADCVKEAMVLIHNAIIASEHDCYLLSQIHDELVYSCPKSLDGVSNEWHNSTHCFTYVADNEADWKSLFTDANRKHFREPANYNYPYLYCSFPLFVKLTMIKAANRFLKNVKMQATFEIHDTWTK